MGKKGYTSKKGKGEKIVFIVLAIAMVLCCVMMMQRTDNGQRNVNAFSFEIGGLSAEGKEAKTTACIRMKDGLNVDGLEIVVAEEADIKYSVYFYAIDEDGEEVFISVLADLDADLDTTSIPEDAELFKVVIEPTSDAEVSFWEINGYAQQLTITYNK